MTQRIFVSLRGRFWGWEVKLTQSTAAREKEKTMLVETRYEHIILNDLRVPVISGTTMKVIELVLAQTALIK